MSGWSPPMITNADGKEVPRPDDQQTNDEDNAAYCNSKALNAIINEVDMNQFKLISKCEVAKEGYSPVYL